MVPLFPCSLAEAVSRRLVDSNVFVRSIVITCYHFNINTGRVADFLRRHTHGLLYTMMKAIRGPEVRRPVALLPNPIA